MSVLRNSRTFTSQQRRIGQTVSQSETLMTLSQQHIRDGDSYGRVVDHWKASIYQAIKKTALKCWRLALNLRMCPTNLLWERNLRDIRAIIRALSEAVNSLIAERVQNYSLFDHKGGYAMQERARRKVSETYLQPSLAVWEEKQPSRLIKCHRTPRLNGVRLKCSGVCFYLFNEQ